MYYRITKVLLALSLLIPPCYTRSMPDIKILFYDPLNTSVQLKNALSTNGYQVSAPGVKVDKNALLITTIFDDQVSRHLQSGGRAVILCDSLEAFPDGAPFKVKNRDQSPRINDDHSGDTWIKIDAGPFISLEDNSKDAGEFGAIEPRFVITNVKGENSDDVFARIKAGENTKGSIAAIQMHAAGGKVFITTFRFDEYGKADKATRFLNAIIGYSIGPNFDPKLDWHIREE
jgi:hypothetical protein